jgi:hypothetical protein
MDENTDQQQEKQPAKKKAAKVCPLCGKKGHLTAQSKHCLFNLKHPEYKGDQQPVPIPTESTTNNNDADDVDAMDSLPLDLELLNQNFDEQDDFHDCGTWSEDSNGNGMTTGII